MRNYPGDELPGWLRQWRICLQCGRPVFEPWVGKIPKGMATHSSIRAWRIPWTERPGELQSMGSQRVKHNGTTDTEASSSKIHVGRAARLFWKIRLRLHFQRVPRRAHLHGLSC